MGAPMFAADAYQFVAVEAQITPVINSERACNSQQIGKSSNENVAKPYPWKSVITWTIVGFLGGFFAMNPSSNLTSDLKFLFKITTGIEAGMLFGFVVGIYRYFRRD